MIVSLSRLTAKNLLTRRCQSDPVSVFTAPSVGDEENGEPAAGEDELEEGELHDTSTEETPEFYNKTKSFFDNISCDAVEKTREWVSISGNSLNGDGGPKLLYLFNVGQEDCGRHCELIVPCIFHKLD